MAVAHSATLSEKRFTTKVIFVLSLGQLRGWRLKTREHWKKNWHMHQPHQNYPFGMGTWGSLGTADTSCGATLDGPCSVRPEESRSITLAHVVEPERKYNINFLKEV